MRRRIHVEIHNSCIRRIHLRPSLLFDTRNIYLRFCLVVNISFYPNKSHIALSYSSKKRSCNSFEQSINYSQMNITVLSTTFQTYQRNGHQRCTQSIGPVSRRSWVRIPFEHQNSFLGFVCNCLSYFTTANIFFASVHCPQFSLMTFIIYTSHRNID